MRARRTFSRGFSLIEIMVSLAIGMFAMVIMMQVFGAAEGNKRTTTGGNDAQISAALGLYNLERDIRQAGQGVSAFTVLGCSLNYTSTASGEAVALNALGPLTLNSSKVPAGDDKTDTLLVVAGSSAGSSEGDPLTAISQATSLTVTVPASFAVGDWVLAAPATRAEPCALVLGKVTAIAGSVLTVTNATTGLVVNDIVYNLGSSPTLRAYAVRSKQLKSCDYLKYDCSKTTDDRWSTVAGGVVSLRAQYARDNTVGNMSGIVGVYDQATPGSAADTAVTLALNCRWARIIGLRLAVVAQSAQYDKTYTAPTPTWAGSTDAPIDLSKLTDYQYYRYKTLETTVPLRNMIWQGSQTNYQGGTGGC
ncbi:MAG TPA: PilW family protein [Candidatus Aquabacterium excrementipullorum]|nr:PilW family protein [Candidatus Aquabacterium excrementipullorum]